MLTPAQLENPSTITIPVDQGAISFFNSVFAQVCERLCQLFPGVEDFQKLYHFAAAVQEVDSVHMMVGVRAWLDYFNSSVYAMAMQRDPALWQVTTFMGVNMVPYWDSIAPGDQEIIWLFVQVLMNTANVLRQVPKERLIQLNTVIVNLKDIAVQSLPILMQAAQSFVSGFAPGTPGHAQGVQMIGSLLGSMGMQHQ